MSTFQRHPSFFSSLLPDLPSRSHFSVSCLRGLPDDCWDKTSGQFGFTTLQNEKYMYEPLVKTLNAIITFMTIESTSTFGSPECPATSSSKIKSPVLPVYEFVGTYQDFANRDGLEEGVKEEPHRNRRPDIAMVLKSPDGLRRSWYDVALSIEVKKDRWAHAIAQAEDQAEAILTNAPTKRFLFSFLLCDSSLEVCLWDRAGVITSEPIDVNENPLQFIEVVRRFASMSPMELGFDETAIDIPEGVKSPIQRGPIGSPVVAIDQDIYYRIKTVSCSSSCFGRSTRCFEARKLVKGKGKWSNKTYLLKYFWNDVKRQPDEGEIYERVKKANVTSGVADCVAFVRLTKLSDIRKGLPLLRDEAKEEKNHSSEKVEIGGLIGDRQLCVLVLATVGRSISEPTTVYELIAAMKTAIKGHQEIYQRAGILHRDISTNNVRIRDPPMVFVDGVDEDDINDRNTSLPSDDGFLIDFDLSMIEDDSDQNRSERLARTGTFAFMAWQIMDGDSISMEEDDGAPDTPLHSFKHDLQSFFWVLLYICAGCPWFTQKPLDCGHPSGPVMRIFSEPKEDSAATLKMAFLQNKRRRLWVSEPFEVIFGLLIKMRTLLSPENWEVLTHDAFISVLDEALQDPAVLSRLEISPHKVEPPYLKPRYKNYAQSRPLSATAAESPQQPYGPSAREKVDGSAPKRRTSTFKEPLLESKSTFGHSLSQRPRGSSSKKRAADPVLASRTSKRSRIGGE